MLRVDVRVAEDVQLRLDAAQLLLELRAAARLGHLVHAGQRRSHICETTPPGGPPSK